MSQTIECPICYDEIVQTNNCVTTECGHQFHCKCLMQNSATNGFSCPMCRTKMAEQVEDSDDELSEYEDYEDDEEEPYDDNALTSFRMFHQQLSGEEVEEDDADEGPDAPAVAEQEEEEEEVVKPTAECIALKLIAQGYTMEDMVKCLLIEHEEYSAESERFERCADRMFGKFRQIISNYPREEQERQSTRLRVEDSISSLQSRYRILDDDEEV